MMLYKPLEKLPPLEEKLIKAFPARVRQIVQLFETFGDLNWPEARRQIFCRQFILNWVFFQEMENADHAGITPEVFVQAVETQGAKHPAVRMVYEKANGNETGSNTPWFRVVFQAFVRRCAFWL